MSQDLIKCLVLISQYVRPLTDEEGQSIRPLLAGILDAQHADREVFSVIAATVVGIAYVMGKDSADPVIQHGNALLKQASE